jgi:TfoX/Sxy family transcriptional regulator of competence genes
VAAKPDVEELAARIRGLLGGQKAVVEKRMFGGIAFLVNGNMSVSSSGNGGLMLRCEPADTAELTAEPGVSRVVMRGREMDGWIRVDATAVGDDAALQRWVRVGVDYARSLPPKG